jgi:L-methionine (R)-S-oxide reductase
VNDALAQLGALGRLPAERAVRARMAAEVIRAARGYRWVGVYDVTASHITAIGWTGLAAPQHPTFPRTQGLNGAAVAQRAPVIVQDVRSDPRYLTTFGSTRAEAIFPVCIPAGVVGTIDVESDRIDAFTPEDEAFLRQCAERLAFLWN